MSDHDTVSEEHPLRVVVVGAGGVGGWLLEGISRMLEYRRPGSALIVVDGDTYEPKNSERQVFADLGNKAIVKATELQPFVPQTFVVPVGKWVVAQSADADEEGVERITPGELLEDGDIVFATVDNFATRVLLFDHARTMDNVDIFTGGNDEALFGTTYHYQRRDGKDVTDHPGEYNEEFRNPPDRNPGALSCAERAELEGSTQFLATNMAVAAWLLGRMQHLILDGKEDTETEIHFDLGVGRAQPFNRLVTVADAAAATHHELVSTTS